MKKKKGIDLTSDEAGMLALYDRVADFTKKENINAIIENVQSVSSGSAASDLD